MTEQQPTAEKDAPYRALLGLILENVHVGVSNDDIVVDTERFPAPAHLRAALATLVEEWIDGEATCVTSPAEQGAGDYTACGHRMIAANLGLGGGTARVAVYCDRPVNHDGNHHADVEWDGLGRAAQGDARRHLDTRVLPPGGSDA